MSKIENNQTSIKNHIQGKSLMALDVGKKRIGIATCDPSWTIVTPLRTLKRTKFSQDAQILVDLITERQSGGLVVGLPLNMDGTEGGMCQSVRDFVHELKKINGFPADVFFFFQDERLTSERAEQKMIQEMDLSRQKRKKAIDQLAAVEILERFLLT